MIPLSSRFNVFIIAAEADVEADVRFERYDEATVVYGTMSYIAHI